MTTHKTKQCKWCGRTFTPKHNRQIYCSNPITIEVNGETHTTTCREEAHKEQKKLYKRRYDKQYRKYEYYYPNNNILGTTNPSSQHMKENIYEEYTSIQHELQRLGLRQYHKPLHH